MLGEAGFTLRSYCACSSNARTVWGVVGGSRSAGNEMGVIGRSTVDISDTGRRERTLAELYGISPVFRNEEMMVVGLKACSRIDPIEERNRTVLKSEHLVRVA